MSSPSTARALTLGLVLAVPSSSIAREAFPADGPIKDNMFLLEEAYNQETGVLHHNQYLLYVPSQRLWTYSYTEEWPAVNEHHQLSATVPLAFAQGRFELGDLLLHYRYQALDADGVAIAPRASLVLPTGDWRHAFGRGNLGVQLAVPVSLELSSKFVLHLNANATFVPRARTPEGARLNAVDASAAAGLVWLAAPAMNLLIEASWTNSQRTDAANAGRSTTFVLDPGVRFAFNMRGLQVVPGLGLPLSVTDGQLSPGALAYLSFEHPLW